MTSPTDLEEWGDDGAPWNNPPMQSDDNEKLLACPFCGGPVTTYINHGGFVVVCSSANQCEAHPSVDARTREDANAAWNTRALSAPRTPSEPACDVCMGDCKGHTIDELMAEPPKPVVASDLEGRVEGIGDRFPNTMAYLAASEKQDAIATLTARVADLEAALEPFVRSLMWVDTDTDMPVRIANDDTASGYDLTTDEVNRARLALKNQG